MTTRFYIDGLNLYYGVLKGSSDKWLDLEEFARRLTPHDQIDAVKYFTARVVDRYPGDRTGERQQVYLRALRTLPKVDIHLGHFRADVKWRTLADRKFSPNELFMPGFRPSWLYRLLWRDQVRRRTEPATSARVMIYEEKGSDVNLGVNLVHDAAVGTIAKAIVITNDSDLEEAIRLARSSGIAVGVVNPHRGAMNKRLKRAADFEIPLRREILAQCQLPEHLTTNKGRQIHRPKEWR